MGNLMSMYDEYFPPKPTWGTEDIPDLTGKVMIVTGGNTGIGKETVKALLAHNAKVYLAARNKSKALAAIADLSQQTGGKEAIWLELDLADLKSVKRAVEEFTSKEKHLHVLFNNAGVMMADLNDLTAQGYDLQFGTNVLGHFYLTTLLIPTLLSTYEITKIKTRIVNTSSSGHASPTGLVDFGILREVRPGADVGAQGRVREKRKGVGSFGFYLQSKLGNVLFAKELSRRYGSSRGIISTSLNPGNLSTELTRTTPWYVLFVAGWIFYPSSLGALTQLWAGTSVEGEEFDGKYLMPWARHGEASDVAKDEVLGRELWEWMEEQVKEVEGEGA